MLHVIVHFLAMKPVQCPASRAALNSGPLLLASRKPLKVRQTTPRNGCLAVACKLLLDKYPKSLPLILAKQTGCSAPGSKLNFVALTCSWLFSLWLAIQATALSSMRVVVDSQRPVYFALIAEHSDEHSRRSLDSHHNEQVLQEDVCSEFRQVLADANYGKPIACIQNRAHHNEQTGEYRPRQRPKAAVRQTFLDVTVLF